jgi:hypothetical protein
MRRFLIVLTFVSFAGWSQPAKQPPQAASLKPKPPTVTCSDKATLKACTSFKQLIDAHDKDMLESISSHTSYVCFRPDEDAFIIFHAEKPRIELWKTSEDNLSQVQRLKTVARLMEYRDGVFYLAKFGSAYWERLAPNEEPTFHSETTDGRFKGLQMSIDPAEIDIEYPFKNANGGTTQYSLTIRRSTGRFIEKVSSEDTPRTLPTTSSGTCLIYR